MLKAILRGLYSCGVHNRLSHCSFTRLSNGGVVLKLKRPYQIPTVTLTSSASLLSKTYVETENTFAHAIMEKNEIYSSSLAPSAQIDISVVNEQEFLSILAKDWSNETASAVYRDFKKISDFTSIHKREITELVFDGLCEAIVVKQSEFTAEELAAILRCLSQWPQTDGLNSRNFSNVWSAIDRQCVARVRTWDNTTLLYIADHW